MMSQRWISTDLAGRELGISQRMVAQLLQAGRIVGARQLPNGRWVIPTPVRRLPGTRGPRFRRPNRLSGVDLQLAITQSERLKDPAQWEGKAAEILEASRILEPHMRDYWPAVVARTDEPEATELPHYPAGVYFMLVAFAFENLLKAVLIRQRRIEMQARLYDRLPRFLRTHDLLHLFNEAGLSIDTGEEELLTRLTRNSMWSGRYPTPMRPDDLMGADLLSDGRWHLTAYFGPQDVDRIQRLLERVRNHLASAATSA